MNLSHYRYKFLITYGQLFCAVKLICLHLGVIMCAMDCKIIAPPTYTRILNHEILLEYTLDLDIYLYISTRLLQPPHTHVS